jgi:RNA polymerase sigma-70 factor, ECF subfamily
LNAFEGLFRELFKPLCSFAMKLTGDPDDAKNLVHEVFIQVWDKFDSLPASTNYKSYCFTAVRNKCLNYIRDKKKFVLLSNVPEELLIRTDPGLESAELQQKIEEGISSLPEKCRIIFELNRMEGLRYSQIAEKLNISVKTVEAQMSKALAVMKEHLKEFLSIIFLLWP